MNKGLLHMMIDRQGAWTDTRCLTQHFIAFELQNSSKTFLNGIILADLLILRL